MSVYLVTWDLNKEGVAYQNASEKLHGRLDKLQTIKHEGLDSVRFVETDMSAEQLYNYIAPGVLDGDDRIIVSHMDDNHWGALSQEIWDWLNARI